MTEKPPIEKILEHFGAPFVPIGARWRRMKCPFHEDRTASASVNTEQQRFRCFACDINEDAYGLVIWKGDAKDFVSAKRFIEELLGRSYGNLPPSTTNGRRNTRRGVFEEQGPAVGQRTILQARSRRKPLTGA